jgi:hypothetical protein
MGTYKPPIELYKKDDMLDVCTPSNTRLYSYVNMKIYNLLFTTFVNYFTVVQYWC